MVWGYYLLLLLTAVVGLAFTVVTLPGLWLIVGAAAVYAWLTGGVYLGIKTLVALLLMAAGAEVAELVFGGAGAKKAGGTAWGVGGGLVGGVVGGIVLTPFIPIYVLGTVVGICLGTFLGAFGLELLMGKPVGDSLRIGVGAFKGKITGIAGKVLIGGVMLAMTTVIAFPWPHRDRPAVILRTRPADAGHQTQTAPATSPTTMPVIGR